MLNHLPKSTLTRDYRSFLKDFRDLYEKDSYEFKARPGQSLSNHLLNVLNRNLEYLREKTEHKPKLQAYFLLTSIINAISHDLGKLIPIFQYRLFRVSKNKSLCTVPKEYLHFSYHTLFGAICSWIIYEYLTDLEEFDSLEVDVVLVKYLSVEAIISHHNAFLIGDIEDQTSLTYRDDLNVYFSQISDLRNEVDEFFVDLIRIVKESLSKSEYLNDFRSKNGPLLDLILKVPDSLEHLRNMIIGDGFASEAEEVVDEVEDMYDEISPDPIYGSQYEWPFDQGQIFCMECYLSSLLFDLDIWDARYWDNPKKNGLFAFYRSQSIPDPNIVEKYVSMPFGRSSPNINDFQPEEATDIIQFLRNSLFSETNYKTSLLQEKIFILNSPTGAGKTLTLLNLAFKASTQFKSPKIIYALPFVSIGVQVAEEIGKLNGIEEENIYNSGLLTIDNYAMDKIWANKDGGSSNQADYIYGNDAKWLINSWQSQFIVTTFVKLFHRFLKPYKNNVLGFHRFHDTIIILDEIQCIPVKYWELTRQIICHLVEVLNCKVFLSTATQPAIFDPSSSQSCRAVNIAPNHLQQVPPEKLSTEQKKQSLDQMLNRYSVVCFSENMGLQKFACNLESLLVSDVFMGEHVLITVNTKAAAVYIYRELTESKNPGYSNTEFVMLSTLVLSRDRKQRIAEIKKLLEKKSKKKGSVDFEGEKRYVVIATQVIEAGVDLSFKYVFRDLAPLDSVVQVAGRCNRSKEFSMGYIFLVNLEDDLGTNMAFFHQVYHITQAEDATRELLKKSTVHNATLPLDISDALENAGFNHKYRIAYEKSLRAQFSAYFAKIKGSNYHKDLIDTFNNLRYPEMAKQYKMIDDEYQNQVLLLVDKEIMVEHRKWKSGRRLTNLFYKYIVSLPNRWFDQLTGTNVIQTVRGKDGDVLYYYIDKVDCEDLYDPKTGFML